MDCEYYIDNKMALARGIFEEFFHLDSDVDIILRKEQNAIALKHIDMSFVICHNK